MRILTGHDYYDTALAWGSDTDIVFLRYKDKLINHKDTPFYTDYFRQRYISLHPSVTTNGTRYNSDSFQTRTTAYICSPVIVYFCGKRYNGIKVSCRNLISHESTEIYFWTYTSFISWLASKNIKANERHDSEHSIENHFKTQITKKEFDFLLENKYTIVVSQRNMNEFDSRDKFWKVDSPDLKIIQFYKLFDEYSAFQEISMWVGGVLTGQGRPMLEISDKYKIHKHGFNEWSFRKPPQGK